MNKVAHALLESKSVHIEPNPDNYYTWTSGTKAPIYCDNRQLISYPNYRYGIVQKLIHWIQNNFPQIEVIAGTATAGIPWAAWVSHELELPMIYIRSTPKGHGRHNTVEGKITHHQSTLILEDLISTGKSSITAYENAKKEGLEVHAVLSIFNYDFKTAKDKFLERDLPFHSLCDLNDLMDYARETSLLNEAEISTVLEWKQQY